MNEARISRRGLLGAAGAAGAAAGAGLLGAPALAGEWATAGTTSRSSAAASSPASCSTSPSPAWSTPAPTSAAPTGWTGRRGRWIPLLDWVGWDQWGWTGRGQPGHRRRRPRPGLRSPSAPTPTTGIPNNGAILRSRDRGRTWKVTALPFKLGGNMPGRGMGERLAIDPNRNSILYLGAPSGHGLWRSTDYGAHLGAGGQLPERRATTGADPNDTSGYSSDLTRAWCGSTFDPRTGSRRRRHPDASTSAWPTRTTRSTAPPTAARPGQRCRASPPATCRTRACSTTSAASSTWPPATPAGPYDGGAGEVWKLDTATGAWTRHHARRPRRGLGLRGPDHRPAEPGHAHGGHPDRLVAGRGLLPQHRRRRDLDPRLGLGRLARPDQPLRPSTSPTSPWLTWNATPAAARAGAEAGLDDRVAGDRPVRLQPPALRHRRDDLRHRQPDRLGHRRHRAHRGAGPGPGGDRGARPDQPAGRRAPALGGRRRRRLRAPRLRHARA